MDRRESIAKARNEARERMEDMKMQRGWIGVDLDGTLAVYTHWEGIDKIGAPVAAMVERVKGWLSEGKDVRIFTARVCDLRGSDEVVLASDAIRRWCQEHIGTELPITCVKDWSMVELWDDRCVQVIQNTGARVDGSA